MFRMPVAIACILAAAVAFASPETSARSVLLRTIGKRADHIVLEAIPKEGKLDVFEVEAANGKLTVRGSTGVAMARGAYEYLKDKCGVLVTWEGKNVNLPARWPDQAKRRVVCPNQYRHYFNVCTFGYSMAWWDWKRWEREIDWMALHGINMPLAMTGQEAIWQTVFHDLKVPQKGLDEFFVGPAFLPWHWMGNIDKHAGPLPQSWMSSHVKLQQQILGRERELGMTPVTPGFSGFVPKAFALAHPEAKIRRSAAWAGFEPTYLLDPRDPLFVEIGRRFVREYRRVFGSDHLYLCDVFNEMTPVVDPARKYEDLSAFGKAVYDAVRAGDPDGIWVMQGWLFFNERDFWGQKEVSAFLDPVPDNQMIVVDLACDSYEVWRNQPAVREKPWIFCTLHNFGQTTTLFGNLKTYATKPATALNDPNKGGMAGMGTTPEGIEQNSVVYELVTDAMWRRDPIDVASWITRYRVNRYGGDHPLLKEAWDLIHEVFYSGGYLPGAAQYFKRPRVNSGGEPSPDLPKIRRACECLLLYMGQHGGNAMMERDLVDVEKRYLEEIAGGVLGEAFGARDDGDSAKFFKLADDYLAVLSDIDRLLAVRPEYHLTRWIDAARSLGATPVEKDLYEKNARMQVTVWGGPILYDYAWKEWAGLTKDFYRERWRNLFEAMKSRGFYPDRWELAEGLWESNWTARTQKPEESPVVHWDGVAQELLDKYRDYPARWKVDPGIAVGKPATSSDGVEASHVAGLAVDGTTGTYWSASPYPKWWQVDLQKPERIGTIQVVTYADGERYYQYTIEISLDGKDWKEVVDMSQNRTPATSRGFKHRIPNQPMARYVRVNMLRNSANIGVHLAEVRVYRAAP